MFMNPPEAERIMREVALAMAATKSDLLVLSRCGQFPEAQVCQAMKRLDDAAADLREAWTLRTSAKQEPAAAAIAGDGRAKAVV